MAWEKRSLKQDKNSLSYTHTHLSGTIWIPQNLWPVEERCAVTFLSNQMHLFLVLL